MAVQLIKTGAIPLSVLTSGLSQGAKLAVAYMSAAKRRRMEVRELAEVMRVSLTDAGLYIDELTAHKVIKPHQHRVEPVTELPHWLDRSAWSEWETYRKEINKRLTPSSIKQQLKLLEAYKDDQALIIYESIRNGWTGLFPLKNKHNTSSIARRGSFARAEDIAAAAKATENIDV